MSTHQTTLILPSNNPWFDAPDVPAPEDVDACTATLAFRRTRRKQFQVGLGEEVIIGRRHTTHSLQPTLDLTDYNALQYGVSRLHAKIRHEDYGWWLEDLGSANGTWVNGHRLEPYTPVSLGVKNQIILSTFQFYLFLPANVVSGLTLPTADSKHPLHVVNVEDDRDLQRLMSMAFKESEPTINLQQFVSGDQALPYITQHAQNIDLFVLDIMLPGKYNGIEIAQQIRKLGAPGYITLTSAFAEPNMELLSDLRAEFYPKPLHILDIIPRLSNYRLNRSQIAVKVAPALSDTQEAYIPADVAEPTEPVELMRRHVRMPVEQPAPAYVAANRSSTYEAEPAYENAAMPAYAAVGVGVAEQPSPPSVPIRQTTVKLNVLQRLINKLKGL
jgi:CheY-like chemotaxis protein